MNTPNFSADDPTTLIGAGGAEAGLVRLALSLAPRIVAADGGADVALAHGVTPEAVIGDLDSLSPTARAALADRLHRIAEQESTDFDKALRSIDAPLVLGVGFDGDRLDHLLACFNTLTQRAGRPCVLLTRAQLVFLCPPDLQMNLPQGALVSLFPMAVVRGRSEGLEWPIEGLEFSPTGRVGTSNRVTRGAVRLQMDAPAMLVILSLESLPEVVRALLRADRWHASE